MNCSEIDGQAIVVAVAVRRRYGGRAGEEVSRGSGVGCYDGDIVASVAIEVE